MAKTSNKKNGDGQKVTVTVTYKETAPLSDILDDDLITGLMTDQQILDAIKDCTSGEVADFFWEVLTMDDWTVEVTTDYTGKRGV